MSPVFEPEEDLDYSVSFRQIAAPTRLHVTGQFERSGRQRLADQSRHRQSGGASSGNGGIQRRGGGKGIG